MKGPSQAITFFRQIERKRTDLQDKGGLFQSLILQDWKLLINCSQLQVLPFLLSFCCLDDTVRLHHQSVSYNDPTCSAAFSAQTEGYP